MSETYMVYQQAASLMTANNGKPTEADMAAVQDLLTGLGLTKYEIGSDVWVWADRFSSRQVTVISRWNGTVVTTDHCRKSSLFFKNQCEVLILPAAFLVTDEAAARELCYLVQTKLAEIK